MGSAQVADLEILVLVRSGVLLYPCSHTQHTASAYPAHHSSILYHHSQHVCLPSSFHRTAVQLESRFCGREQVERSAVG
eukprot:3546958-Rhodomonas_salina.1